MDANGQDYETFDCTQACMAKTLIHEGSVGLGILPDIMQPHSVLLGGC